MDNKPLLLDPSLDKQLKGHRNAITSLFYSPNETQIASGSLDNSILLWDLGGTMRSYRFRGHDEAVTDVTFSPSGKYMASASRDATVRLWVPTVTGSTGVFKAHSQTVRSVQFSPDGAKILTASDDKVIKLWSSDKYKFISSFVGHTNWVRCARMSNDSSIIASCSDDKTTKLWNPESGELIHTYKDQKGNGLYLAWHPSGCYIAVGTSQGNIKLYDVRTHNLVQYYSVHNDAVTQVAFHPSGSYIITASKDGKIKILDLLEGHPIFTLSGHSGTVNAVNFSPTGQFFASAGDDKLVNLWKTNFTELASDTKENVVQNPSTVPRSTSQTSRLTSASKSKQGTRYWYLCYHSVKYPVTTFVHLDETELSNTRGSITLPSLNERPNANSTMNETYSQGPRTVVSRHKSTPLNASFKGTSSYSHSTPRNDYQSPEYPSFSVGHTSHIPRSDPPKASTYTIPSIMDKSVGTEHAEHIEEEDIFGMIKLKQNDVCYTSGTIEWVGKKRSYPINSGFKLLSGNDHNNGPLQKLRRIDTFSDKTFSCAVDKIRECDCADMLPTVNAIVDHLNALHKAVDLVDLRLNTLEHTVTRND